MYLGRILEITTPEELYANPMHPYTQGAACRRCACPIPDLEASRDRIVLEGEVPSPVNPPSGLRLSHEVPGSPRPACSTTVPLLREVGNDHEVACLAAE